MNLVKSQWARIVLLLLLYGSLLVVGLAGGTWLKDYLRLDDTVTAPHLRRVLWFGIALYVVLLATPFVPGIEISFAILAAFGKEAALLVYVASIVALLLSYLIGRLVPLRVIGSLFQYLGMTRAETFIRRLEPLNRKQRLSLLVESAPKRMVPTLIRHRYLAIAVMLNLPGNAVLGGGGGIALLAGVSGLFAFAPFAGVVAMAVMPIPLAAFLLGG